MFARWKKRRDTESGMADEIRFHIEARAADLIKSGSPPPKPIARPESNSAASRPIRSAAAKPSAPPFGALCGRTSAMQCEPLQKVVASHSPRSSPSPSESAPARPSSAMTDAVLLKPLPYRDSERLVLGSLGRSTLATPGIPPIRMPISTIFATARMSFSTKWAASHPYALSSPAPTAPRSRSARHWSQSTSYG